MTDIKLGYSTPTIVVSTLSDGSKVFGVFMSGDKDITLHCIDEHAATNLCKILDFSVVDIDIC